MAKKKSTAPKMKNLPIKKDKGAPARPKKKKTFTERLHERMTGNKRVRDLLK